MPKPKNSDCEYIKGLYYPEIKRDFSALGEILDLVVKHNMTLPEGIPGRKSKMRKFLCHLEENNYALLQRAREDLKTAIIVSYHPLSEWNRTPTSDLDALKIIEEWLLPVGRSTTKHKTATGEADYIFLHKSKAQWQVKFQNEGPNTIPHRAGFEYIRELLQRPREEIGVGKLVKTEAPQPNHAEDDDLATGNREVLRALADKKRSAVSKAIDRAVAALRNHGMPHLADHLDATIEKGFTPRYNPETPLPWKLS